MSEAEPCLVHCFACKFKSRSLVYMFQSLARFDPRYIDYIERASLVEQGDLSLMLSLMPAFRGLSAPKADYLVYRPEDYQPYSRKLHSYLAGRGVTKETASVWEAGWDEEHRRVTFPLRDPEYRLVGAVGRHVDNEVRPRYHNYWQFKKGTFLFGESLVRKEWPLIVVEGVLDAVLVWQHVQGEYSVVSTMGTDFSKEQVERIIRLSSSVTIAFDNDDAGRHGTRDLVKALHRRVRLKAITYYKEHRQGLDPAELGADILPMIAKAKLAY